ncbi:MAG: FAD-dependent oxidoreductase, partial [Acidobacteriota bacterium]
CGVEEAEAPFALATMDYHFRGTGHVRGGIGRLAWGLVDGIRRLGGEVRFTERVKGLERDGNAWRVLTRRGEFRAGAVVANVLPQALKALLKDPSPGIPALDDLARQVEGGWGACMLYRAVRAGADDHPHHLELIQDEGAPFEEGNHLFCSSSGPADGDRAPQGLRTLTVSTHVPMATLRGLSKDERGPYVAGIQERMRRGLRRLAPELDAATELERTASPRTFERFTGRPHGYVGGVPRRAGTANYRQLIPAPVLPGLHLVGDTVFPGQSTLATALGGVKLAARLHGRGHADAAPRRRDDGAGLEIPIPS